MIVEKEDLSIEDWFDGLAPLQPSRETIVHRSDTCSLRFIARNDHECPPAITDSAPCLHLLKQDVLFRTRNKEGSIFRASLRATTLKFYGLYS